MINLLKPFFVAVAFATLITSQVVFSLGGSAHDSTFPGQFMRCQVKNTSDRFVALRRGPVTSSTLLRKIRRPNGKPAAEYNIFPESRSNGWVYVNAILYNQNSCEDSKGCFAWSGKGFVHGSLIDWASCNNAG